ncbi:MAG: alpha/beta hydrolase [Bacteroidetes bacterium]|nr:alpha/beta hydrolase [Bacteroidota bacterium]MDA0873803.1 alpha/beta hydrolase [Bacteroidota bacterium]
MRSVLAALLFLAAFPASSHAQFLGPGDFEYPEIPADVRMAYGADSLQWGVLRLPNGPGPHPVLVMLHGGCWVGLHRPRHVEPLMEALTARGWATWNLSHRNANDQGGGWRGTFDDVGAGIDFLREIADPYGLDTTRVVTIGHLAGGHLALWAATRDDASSPLELAGAVSLGGIPDLEAHAVQDPNPCGDGVRALLGGWPDEEPERYATASPAEHLPLGVPQLFLHGRHDYVVPWQQIEAYSASARAAGDDVTVRIFEDASHFEVIAPSSEAWQASIAPAMLDWLQSLEPAR